MDRSIGSSIEFESFLRYQSVRNNKKTFNLNTEQLTGRSPCHFFSKMSEQSERLDHFAERFRLLQRTYFGDLSIALAEMKNEKLFNSVKEWEEWVLEHTGIKSSHLQRFVQAGSYLQQHYGDDLTLAPQNLHQCIREIRKRKRGTLDHQERVSSRTSQDRFPDEDVRNDVHSYMDLWLSSESNEWYTPPWIIEKVVRVLGTIDTDPASCEVANKVVKASNFYTESDNGLIQPWVGNVFCNPPGGQTIERQSLARLFWEVAIAKFEKKEFKEGLFLLKLDLHSKWQHEFLKHPHCFITIPIAFYKPNNVPTSPSPFPYIMVYLGSKEELFVSIFRSIGSIPGYGTGWCFRQQK